MTKHDAIDWDAIKAEYVAGILSIRAIAKTFGVGESSIRKRAQHEGWVRGVVPESAHQSAHEAKGALPAKIAAAVEPARSPDDAIDILKRARREAETLLTELEQTRRHLDAIEDEIIVETRDDGNTRRRSMMMKAVSLPTRSATLRTLTQALTAIVEMEKAKGKKAETLERAQEAAGKFAAPPPPRVVVDNSKP